MSSMPQQRPSASELRQQIDAQVQAARAQADAARAQAQASAADARAQVEAQRDAAEAQRARMEELRAELEGARTGQDEVTVVPTHSEFPRSDIPKEAVVISIAFFLMVAVIVIGLPIVRAFTRRMENRPASPALGADASAQLQRIEHAVESMAIEVERISEAQRFTARLESERIGDGSSRRGI